ncbi:MAG: hypothetical protein K2I80_06175 [Ruminococcus sp.]|nr:hypothetical protein [Ruminococcus sp.]
MEIEKKSKNFSFGFGTARTAGTGSLSEMKKSDSYESRIIENFRKRKNITEKSVKLIAKYIKLKNK